MSRDGQRATRVGGVLEIQDSMWPDIVLAGGKTTQERYEEFHDANPWVFQALERMIVRDIAEGHRVGGIRMYWEVLRWQYNRRTVGAEPFKVSDHFTAHYVRALVDKHPDWAEHFALRQIRAA